MGCVCRDGDVELREEGVGTEEESHSGHGNSTTSAASSSAFTLIETAHPVFGAVRKLWNSQTESHRVVGGARLVGGARVGGGARLVGRVLVVGGLHW